MSDNKKNLLKKYFTARSITQTAMIAGLYAAVTFATFYMSFGAVQFRISEALTILPIFTATAVPGLTLGCAIANLLGFFIGANPLGLMDALFGTAASLIAAVLTCYIGKSDKKWVRYVLCPLPPVLLNALIVGFEITWLFNPLEPGFYLLNFSLIFLGQAAVCYGLGIPLIYALQKNDLYKKIFRN